MTAGRRLAASRAFDVVGLLAPERRTRWGWGGLTKGASRAACRVHLLARIDYGDVSPPEIVSLRGQEAHRGCAERHAPLSHCFSNPAGSSCRWGCIRLSADAALVPLL